MKIEITIDGMECKASTDFSLPKTLSNEDKSLCNASIYASLREDIRFIATKLIEAKYATTKQGDQQ